MRKIVALFVAVAMLIGISGCSLTESTGTSENGGNNNSFIKKEYEKTENSYTISTSSKYATEAGAKILAEGGNAVDAIIAASYVLAVTEPYASGVAGSGGMTIYDPENDEFVFLNYFAEAAPSGAHSGNMGVPGFVSGMQKAHDLYGSLDMKKLIEPAIELAEKGYKVTETLQYRVDDACASFSTSQTPFNDIAVGETIVQTELASVLRSIAENGSDEFYSGSIAEAIEEATGFTESDMEGYETIVTDAVVDTFSGKTIASAAAPFSGTMLIQMLKMMEKVNIPNPSNDRARFMKDFIKIKLAATYDRANNLSDPRFSNSARNYPTHTSDSYITQLLANNSIKYDEETESEDTTHLSAVDKDGLTVSCTNTLSQFFGSRLYVKGMFVNNSLRNFSSGINAYEPGRRPRTYISPTIVKDEDGGTMAIGTPGGNVITCTLAQVIADIKMFGTKAQSSVDKMRIYVKSSDSIIVETGYDTDYIVDPYNLGYYVIPYTSNAYFGSVNIAGYSKTDGYYGAMDKRRDGYCVVVNN